MDLFSDFFENERELKKNKPDPEIKVDLEFIENQISSFLKNSKSNPFYDKNICFTKGLKGNKYIEFQIIGNLGGWANDEELTIYTYYFIISDKYMKEIKENENHPIIKMLNDKLNVDSAAEKKRIRNYKYNVLTILSEDAFLKHVMKRCNMINDNVTKDLILKLN